MSCKNTWLILLNSKKQAMRCQNNMYNKNNQRYERTAYNKLILKDPSKLRQQSTLCICNGCFIEKIHGDAVIPIRIHPMMMSIRF